jgi:hypothetical protein
MALMLSFYKTTSMALVLSFYKTTSRALMLSFHKTTVQRYLTDKLESSTSICDGN